MKYHKKPVEVEAERVVDVIENAKNNWSHLPSWVVDAIQNRTLVLIYNGIHIKTMEGMLFAPRENWMLVKGVRGEIYPVRFDIFKETYEKVY